MRLDASYGTYYIRVKSAHQKRLFDSILEFHCACDLLEDIAAEPTTDIYAFCLLQQDIHWLIKSKTPALEVIKNWCTRYSQWYHSIHPNTSALFDNAIHCMLIEPKLYLNQLIRYVHLLPQERKLVPNPDIYPWCSHQHYINELEFPWLNSDPLNGEICLKRSRRQNRYTSFINESYRPEQQLDLETGNHAKYLALARAAYVDEILEAQRKLELEEKYSLEDIIEAVCGEYGISTNQLLSKRKIRRLAEIKSLVCWLNLEISKRPFSELAERLNIDLDTVHIYLKSMNAKNPVYIQRFKDRLAAKHKPPTKLKPLSDESKA